MFQERYSSLGARWLVIHCFHQLLTDCVHLLFICFQQKEYGQIQLCLHRWHFLWSQGLKSGIIYDKNIAKPYLWMQKALCLLQHQTVLLSRARVILSFEYCQLQNTPIHSFSIYHHLSYSESRGVLFYFSQILFPLSDPQIMVLHNLPSCLLLLLAPVFT